MTAPMRRDGATSRRRRGALLVVGAAALALGGYASSSAAGSAASAPACLPAKLVQSATLPGASVDVSPAPGSVTANPNAQISFLGVRGSSIHQVSAVGSTSGGHAGRLLSFSQGDGASFVPAKAFAPGERVRVRARIAGHSYAYSFRVDTPWSTARTGGFPNPTAPSSDYQTFYTLPGAEPPLLTVTRADRDPSAGDIFTTNGPGPGRYGAFIYTPQGRLVWVDPLSGGQTADDLRVQNYDGHRDLTFWQGKVLSLGYGQGEDKILNSHYVTVATVKAGNGLYADLHDFELAPHGTAYVTAYNPIRCNLTSAEGPRDGVILDVAVQEIDIKTGLVRWEWHALDHINVNDSETSPPPSRAWDWFHLNSIDPEPNGDVFISSRNTWAGYQLAGASGRILWTLGGLDSSFKMGPSNTTSCQPPLHGANTTCTAWQHDGRILPDGDVTFFDDGSSPPEEYQSRAVRIALDMGNHTARLVSADTHPGLPLLAASQGNVETLASGSTVVGYGGVPVISEYSSSGTLLFDAHLPLDQLFYRAFRYRWSATPASPPAVVASLNNTGLETILRMSWNGATGVGAWRVLAGKSSRSLSAQTTTATTGFETSTILRQSFAYVEVQALDSAGHVLATSHATRVLSFADSFSTAGRAG
jgi:hypothetical protein